MTLPDLDLWSRHYILSIVSATEGWNQYSGWSVPPQGVTSDLIHEREKGAVVPKCTRTGSPSSGSRQQKAQALGGDHHRTEKADCG